MTSLQPPEAASFEPLSGELIRAMQAWVERRDPWPEETLDAWARRAFRVQYGGNQPFRRYCDARSLGPGDVTGWRDYPPVPTAAFRAVDLIVGASRDAEVTFVTSGTTRGRAARGRHLVRSAELYRVCLRAAFAAFVQPPQFFVRMITLPPSFTYQSESSLGFMFDDLRGRAGADGATVASQNGVDWSLLDREIEAAARAAGPVCMLGTTVGFAAWLERLREGRSSARALPAGSVLVDTGGAKSEAGLERSDVVRSLAERLGLPIDSVINEFGMTELLSQRYGHGDPPAPLLGPPWIRSRVLDPVTLEELSEGEVGLLCHFDLANLGSVCAVLTEDRGRILGGGIEWLGRTAGAPPRGCSLATAELLEAQRRA